MKNIPCLVVKDASGSIVAVFNNFEYSDAITCANAALGREVFQGELIVPVQTSNEVSYYKNPARIP